MGKGAERAVPTALIFRVGKIAGKAWSKPFGRGADFAHPTRRRPGYFSVMANEPSHSGGGGVFRSATMRVSNNE